MLTGKVPDRVLVVDAEPGVRETIEGHLTHRGYEVLTAVSGTKHGSGAQRGSCEPRR